MRDRELARRGGRSLTLALLLALTCTVGRADAGGPRDLQPVPPALPFHDPGILDPQTDTDIRHEIDSSFADLNRVVPARARLVRRFGLVSAPILGEVLGSQSSSRTTWWNAALTVAALRDAYGPALELQRSVVGPLVDRLGGGHEEWTGAFCALALGAFPWNEVTPPDLVVVEASLAVPAGIRRDAERLLQVGRDRLALLARGASAPEACAALLAWGRIGGPQAREVVEAIDPDGFGPVPPRQAALLARGLVGSGDAATYLRFLSSETQSAVRAAAALGLAAALARDRPAELGERLGDLSAALEAVEALGQPAEAAEALFARALVARARGQEAQLAEGLWPRLLRPTDTEAAVARAAVQALLFLDVPRVWLDAKCVDCAVNPPRQLRPGVLPFLLFRAGQAGAAEGVKACADWLSQKSKRPIPGDQEDPRPFAAVALLRGLAQGRFDDAETREVAVKGLERAAAGILAKGPFQEALGRLVDQYGAALRSPTFPLAASSTLQALEDLVDDPNGLLVGDVRDLVAMRLDEMTRSLFGLNNLPSALGEDKTKYQGERYLLRYLEAYPYFRRLDLLEERGRRPAVRQDDASPRGLDR
ncbi:MAG: hypothetical protein AB7T63_07130 [Planctomycetota bacterium]